MNVTGRKNFHKSVFGFKNVVFDGVAKIRHENLGIIGTPIVEGIRCADMRDITNGPPKGWPSVLSFGLGSSKHEQ